MSLGDSDVSWDLLRRVVSRWSHEPAELAEVVPLSGGSVSQTLCLHLADGRKAVLKIAPHRVDRRMEVEALQLNHLHRRGLCTPQVLHCNTASLEEPHSWLLLEHMPGEHLHTVRRRVTPDQWDVLQREFAEVIAKIHSECADQYAPVSPNAQAQSFSHWTSYFRHLYEPIVCEAVKSTYLAPRVRKMVSRIHDRLDGCLEHSDTPRLIHGDMWSTNVLCNQDESGVWHVSAILDPNCKYAHAENEIAYLELFGTATSAFIRHYKSLYRLGAGYMELRRPIYQLYTLLNHLCTFGQRYAPRVQLAAEGVVKLV